MGDRGAQTRWDTLYIFYKQNDFSVEQLVKTHDNKLITNKWHIPMIYVVYAVLMLYVR